MISWNVDDRPATPYTRAYVAGMWLNRDKGAFEGEEHTRRTSQELQRRGDHPPTPLARALRTIATAELAGMTTWTVRPRRSAPLARVVYVHGGGYVHPLTADYWRLARAVSAAPAEVVVPAYPLAPGATVDTVLPQLTEMVEVLRRDRPPLPTILMGDSAGGALVLAMACALRDAGAPAPTGVVALSPWLDATLAEDEVADLEASDPMLAESGLRAAGRWWAGAHSPTDPQVSPAAASLHDLPPIDLFIGCRDILRPAVDTFAAHAQRDGATLRVWEVPAMFHVWMTRAIPEARRTRSQLAALVRERAGEARSTSP